MNRSTTPISLTRAAFMSAVIASACLAAACSPQADVAQGEPGASSAAPCETSADCAGTGAFCLDGVCRVDEDFSAGVDDPSELGEYTGFGAGNDDPKEIGAVIDSFCGINAYQNGPSVENVVGNGTYGLEFQCTEFAYRFVCQHYQMCEKKLKAYGHAKAWYSNHTDPVLGRMERHPNGGAEPPAPGDIIVWGNGNHGHVAIVKSVQGDLVQVIEQNVYNGTHAYVLSNANGAYSIPSALGWMRVPGSGPACGDAPSDHAPVVTLTAPADGASIDGRISVLGTAVDADGLKKVTVTLNATTGPVICDNDCNGATQEIDVTIDPAAHGISAGSQVTLAVWVKDTLGNVRGPLAVRTVTWSGATSGCSCSSESACCPDGCNPAPQGAPCGECTSCNGGGSCSQNKPNGTPCSGGSCQNGACTPSCSYAATPAPADYSCGGGVVLSINGSVDASGNVTVRATKNDRSQFGDGDYYVRVFDPNDGVPGNHCKSINTEKAHIVVSGGPEQITFPAFPSLLVCGGLEKGYCVTKLDGGDGAWWCSNELKVGYD
ncbi:CHAP domain-containing protein [Sorangium sp. So ce1151]|uniref:CHAP domain-containing protein n=1 Tax=Sorangium sp. So ce1151 TaxID=3133332 RepID=UPI003F5EC562